MYPLSLFLPTRARGTDLRIFESLFLERLLQERRLERVCIVVVEEEAKQWEGHHLLQLGADLLVLPPATRLEAAKQRILQEPGKIHVISDDDLGLRIRRKGKSPETCTYAEILKLFEMMVDYTLNKGYAHGGISACQTHNSALVDTPDAVLINCRTGGWHWYLPEILRKCGVDYTQAREAEDMHSQLVMLKAGYPNVQLWRYCYDQRSGSKGGCATYRTLQSLNEASRNLQRLHPDCVKLVPKYSKLWGGEVLSVMCYYKRAFKVSGGRLPEESAAHHEETEEKEEEQSEWQVHEASGMYDVGQRRLRRASRGNGGVNAYKLAQSDNEPCVGVAGTSKPRRRKSTDLS